MAGPSAIGSEKGTPSSMMSAPALTSSCIKEVIITGSGSPAVMKGIRAFRFCRRSLSNTVVIRDMKSDLLKSDTGGLRHGCHIFIAATREIHQQEFVAAKRGRKLCG